MPAANNSSSAAGFVPAAYNAMKAALITYSKQLSQFVGKFNVRVNSICPGPIYFEGGAWEMIKGTNQKFYDAGLMYGERSTMITAAAHAIARDRRNPFVARRGGAFPGLRGREVHRAAGDDGGDGVLVDHLRHGVAQQDDVLVEGLDLALQLDAVDQVDGHRHVLASQRVQEGVL